MLVTMIQSMTHKALYLRHSAPGSCSDAVVETGDRATVRNKTLKKRKESLRKQNGQGASPSSCIVPLNQRDYTGGNTPK